MLWLKLTVFAAGLKHPRGAWSASFFFGCGYKKKTD